jgi:transcriptional regulator with XRE-family HTH domain
MPTDFLPAREPHPIALFRQKRGMQAKWFAHEAGITYAYLWRIEQGRVEMPNIHIISALARATEGAVSEFDIFRYHAALMTGVVPKLRAPMTANFSWAWALPRRAAASAAA